MFPRLAIAAVLTLALPASSFLAPVHVRVSSPAVARSRELFEPTRAPTSFSTFPTSFTTFPTSFATFPTSFATFPTSSTFPTSLLASPSPPPPSPTFSIDPLLLTVWNFLLFFAFVLAPGELGSAKDSELISTLLSNPITGGDANRLWFCVWNCFAVAPLTLAFLYLPLRSRSSLLPAAPFLWGSAVLGYFALGPYAKPLLPFLPAPPSPAPPPVSPPAPARYESNGVFDSRIFAGASFLLALSIPFTSGLLPELLSGAPVVSDFVSLASSSRFVSVASLDIAILTALAASLIPEDLALRRGGASLPSDKLVAAATLLLPVLGQALYVAVRPPLPSAPGPLEFRRAGVSRLFAAGPGEEDPLQDPLSDRFKHKVHALMGDYDPPEEVPDTDAAAGNILSALTCWPAEVEFVAVGGTGVGERVRAAVGRGGGEGWRIESKGELYEKVVFQKEMENAGEVTAMHELIDAVEGVKFKY